MHPRQRHVPGRNGRLVRSLLALVVATLVMALTHASMDMPSDPVSGEMVMSTEYTFEVQNGQRLRFANKDTLTRFLNDPNTGLGTVESVAAASAGTRSTPALCPVCGMDTDAPGGPQVHTAHGDQAIYTCSMNHAHQVHDEILSFRVKPSTEDGEQDKSTAESTAAFCSGSGTTMLNGFSLFQSSGGLNPCILLWFPGWILNTPWRYVLGCIVVLLCAIFNEYLLHVRRILRKESNLKQRGATSSSEVTKLLRSTSSSSYVPSRAVIPTWFRSLSAESQHMVHCVMHGVTILLAYMLMLVSMTYDGVLFACCIVGYMAGYYIFGERRESVPEDDAM